MLPFVPSALIIVVAAKVVLIVVIAEVVLLVFFDWKDLLVLGCVVTSGFTELSVIVESVSLDFEPANTIKSFVISKYSPSYDC